MAYPDGFKYTKDHEWIDLTGENGRVGITDYAQQQLGDVVYVELPEVGAKVKLHFSFKHPALKVATEGIVKRCDRDTLRLEPKYDTGIEFHNMPNGDAANLRIVLQALSE